MDEELLGPDDDLEIPGFIGLIKGGCFNFRNIKRIVFHNKPDRDLDLSEAFYNIEVSRIQIRFDHPERVTSLRGAFQPLYKLKEVEFENLNISTVPKLQDCFKSCVSLQSIKFPTLEQIDYEQENRVENMNSTFYACKSLKDYSFLENMDLQKVKDMKYTFVNNDSLVSLDLGKLNLESVETMTHTFDFCGKLESVGQGKDNEIINLPRLKDMSSAFQRCQSLTVFSFQNFRLPSLEDMCETFFNSGLERVDFAGVKLPRLTKMGGCFAQCEQLQEVSLAIVQDASKPMRQRKAIDITRIFEQAINLKRLDIPYKLLVSGMTAAFEKICCTELDLQNIILKNDPSRNKKFISYISKSCTRVLIAPTFVDSQDVIDFLKETLTCVKDDNNWLNNVYLERQYKEQLDENKGSLSKESEKNKIYYRLKLKISSKMQKHLKSITATYNNFENYIEVEYI